MRTLENKAIELVQAFQFEGFSFEDLCNALKHDILLADKVFLPYSYPLAPHQAASFLEFEEGKFIFEEACRGASKTSKIARYMLLKSLTWFCAGIFTAPTFRQALQGFNYALGYVKENSTPRNPINLWRELDGKPVGGGGQQSEARMRFKNGAILKALPMGSGEKIRGERADILFCDEFFKMDREMFNVHILPFLLKPMNISTNVKAQKPESKLLMATSAEYEDCFAYHFLCETMLPRMRTDVELQQQDPNHRRKYIVIDWNIEDLQACHFELEPDVIELQTGNASFEEKQRALYNRWIGISGQFFPSNIAEKLASPQVNIEMNPDGVSAYALTVDVAIAQGGDDFIIHTWKFPGNRRMDLVNSFFGNGLSPDDMAWEIHKFNNTFRPEIIYMDKGGGGLAVVSSLAKRKLILSNGDEISIDNPILLYDEFRLVGQKVLVLNRPSDPKIKEAFMGELPSGQDYISQEEVVLHLTYDTLKKILMGSGEPLIRIPEFASESTDEYYRSEIEILDNIREAVHQMRHLAVKTVDTADGQKEVVRSTKTKVPIYVWKHAKKDAAVTFAYGIVPYLLHYKSERGADEGPPAIIIQPNYFGMDWLYALEEAERRHQI